MQSVKLLPLGYVCSTHSAPTVQFLIVMLIGIIVANLVALLCTVTSLSVFGFLVTRVGESEKTANPGLAEVARKNKLTGTVLQTVAILIIIFNLVIFGCA